MKTSMVALLMKMSILALLGILTFVAQSASMLFSYKCDTVSFATVGELPAAAGPEPSIYIDTNVKMSGMFGGTIKSTAPYSVGINYTDETFTFTEAVFSKVVVTSDDGSEDPGIAALKLPLRIPAQPHQSVNSTAGGKIVKTNLAVISGKIPGVINRDKPITLLLEGHFIKQDGTKVPFKIERKYKAVREKVTKTWAEVMSNA